MPSRVPMPSEVLQAFREELEVEQRSAFLSWLSFTTTFGVARTVTHAIRDVSHGEGSGGIEVNGIHLHHYLWGILTVSAVGGLAVRGGEELRRHPSMAIAFGAGLALIVDEFALLVDLKDVYWAKQGRLSVDVGIGLIAAAGAVLAGLPVWRRLHRNRAGPYCGGQRAAEDTARVERLSVP
jgi:hypothetical protein